MKKIRCARVGFKSGNILIASLLNLLLEEPSYGYSLVEKLQSLGIDQSSVPYGVIYRLLRDMESENLIESEWEIEDSGPSRRVYSITKEGKEYLERWLNNAKGNLKILENLISNIEKALQKEKGGK
ncbi:PadR family transcriptional regulator [Mesoaciditoga lauensis]|uniref:PadR family transcriptional regulator n=1 Tax=Mesoaciditoga lauensis TaxID=1495039 RepID=UPI00068A7E39|nr:PadR family transcriptional regulator [Mesoaciditoga lauensis]